MPDLRDKLVKYKAYRYACYVFVTPFVVIWAAINVMRGIWDELADAPDEFRHQWRLYKRAIRLIEEDARPVLKESGR